MGIVMIIPADVTKPITSTDTDVQPDLDTLQKIVGGYIQEVPNWSDYMGKPCVVYANEEGKLVVDGRDPLPINMRATQFWWDKLGRPVGDMLVGDIVLVIDLPDKDDDDE